MDESSRMVPREKVPADGTLLVTLREGTERVEAILVGLSDGVVAFENYCPHWTDVRLDKGTGATRRDDELVCEKHGATFESDSGFCTFGPCEGATLDEIEIAMEDGEIYLTDDRYSFEQVGSAADRDLSSGSRIGFSGN